MHAYWRSFYCKVTLNLRIVDSSSTLGTIKILDGKYEIKFIQVCSILCLTLEHLLLSKHYRKFLKNISIFVSNFWSLKTILETHNAAGLELNLSKCEFYKRHLEYSGHVILINARNLVLMIQISLELLQKNEAQNKSKNC